MPTPHSVLNKMDPKIIVMAGPDGCGKSTMVNRLEKHLTSHHPHLKTVMMSLFNTRDGIGALFEKKRPLDAARVYLGTLSPLGRFLFLTHAWAEAWDQATSAGADVILIPGYWYKFAVAESLLGLPWERSAQIAACLPQPDLTFLFGADPSILMQRKYHVTAYECGFKEPVNLENFAKFQSLARPVWQKLGHDHKHWVGLNAQESEDEVFAKLLVSVGSSIGSLVTTPNGSTKVTPCINPSLAPAR